MNHEESQANDVPAALVVDSGDEFSHTLCIALEDMGFHVDLAGDVASARSSAIGSYSLFVIDIHPGNSRDALRFVKELRGNCVSAPILICSTLRSSDDIVGVFDAGSDDHISRPVSIPAFKARVNALMRRCRISP